MEGGEPLSMSEVGGGGGGGVLEPNKTAAKTAWTSCETCIPSKVRAVLYILESIKI
jgi:hypothetical protein